MTPERFRELQLLLAMNDSRVMRILDCDDRLIRRWKTGARDIPPEVAGWLEALAAFWAAHPPPRLRGRPRLDLAQMPVDI